MFDRFSLVLRFGPMRQGSDPEYASETDDQLTGGSALSAGWGSINSFATAEQIKFFDHLRNIAGIGIGFGNHF